MPRTVLEDLPADLAFLAPCVCAMLVVRSGFRPSVDPGESPEQAADEEIEQCGAQYEAILQEAVERRFAKGGAKAFQHRVNAFRDSLWKWLNSYNECDTPEMAMLFTIAGIVPQPRKSTWLEHIGSALEPSLGVPSLSEAVDERIESTPRSHLIIRSQDFPNFRQRKEID